MMTDDELIENRMRDGWSSRDAIEDRHGWEVRHVQPAPGKPTQLAIVSGWTVANAIGDTIEYPRAISALDAVKAFRADTGDQGELLTYRRALVWTGDEIGDDLGWVLVMKSVQAG